MEVLLNYLLTAVVFVLVFSILVLIHEFGHFWVAKRSGMKVEEFGMGLPPRIWGKKIGETLYSINWIPFGGFVRIYGEDATDKKMIKSKRSFVGKPLRQRIAVVIAGVVMNFVLAILLLSIAFTVGVQPFLSPNELPAAVNNGLIELSPGVKVLDVEPGSFAEREGIDSSHVAVSLTSDQMIALNEGTFEGTIAFVNTGEVTALDLKSGENLGLEFDRYMQLPVVKIFSLDKGDLLYELGLREGDIILKVNNRQISDRDAFEIEVKNAILSGDLSVDVWRNQEVFNFSKFFEKKSKVIISEVLPDTPAEKAGLLAGDIVSFLDGKEVKNVAGFQEITKSSEAKMPIIVTRGAERLNLEVSPEDNLIGVVLSQLEPAFVNSDVRVFTDYMFFTVDNIQLRKYPWYKAPGAALSESWKVAGMSIDAFGNVVKGIFNGEGVPEEVGGPVKIAYATHVTLQEGGFIDLLTFIAYLSLALAVINILPIPALDGGRLLFLIIEGVRGKQIESKFEMYVHAIGFIFMIFLVFFVSYFDLLSLF